MNELRQLARKLLADKTVGVVIGYEEGQGAVTRPSFATSPEQAEKLVFDARCVQNLASYLSPRRSTVRSLGKPAVVVKACDAKALAGLIREAQVKREDVVVISVACGGVLADPRSGKALSEAMVADRCRDCDGAHTSLADHKVGQAKAPAFGSPKVDARLAELQAMTAPQRFAFFKSVFSECTRCNVCREVCPMCFCARCMADKSEPQWIESSPHLRGNFAWHMLRAMHLAGRCVGCNECERACPAGIPLSLITRKMQKVVSERFGYSPSDDPNVPAPTGAFRLDDAQEFIR
ncbi:MAG: 4Fe-4S dicluster domain-containing protein [Myxococcota bacterium]|jgi:ferredoxin|nr:4Fe-4S dicluster domain-containing protein [Myxococcota bacterium]